MALIRNVVTAVEESHTEAFDSTSELLAGDYWPQTNGGRLQVVDLGRTRTLIDDGGVR